MKVMMLWVVGWMKASEQVTESLGKRMLTTDFRSFHVWRSFESVVRPWPSKQRANALIVAVRKITDQEFRRQKGNLWETSNVISINGCLVCKSVFMFDWQISVEDENRNFTS